MKILNILFFMGSFILTGCSSVTLPVTHEYQITEYSTKKLVSKQRRLSLLVTVPEAVAGYQTEKMLYVNKPFQLASFAKNAWANPPAEMLYPLLVQSLQSSGYFYAVSSSNYTEHVDYRLDTQLLTLEQNFLKKPSTLMFSVKAVLTRISDNKAVASRIINQEITCPVDTPYGGVIAANKASLLLTGSVARFVVSNIKHD